MAHVAEWKKEEVNELKSLIDKYDVIGIVDLLNIPAKQLQGICGESIRTSGAFAHCASVL